MIFSFALKCKRLLAKLLSNIYVFSAIILLPRIQNILINRTMDTLVSKS